jgi:UDP-glucose:(heptosyl)LPS alpha-1,3-glucosyltransferase
MRREWGLKPETVCFLTAAHNFRLKGVRELLAAAGRLRRRRRDFAVVVVGKGKPWSYRRLAAWHGCADVVQFPGPMRDIERAYSAADVYVQPAWYDPFGLVVLEAWACGLPVITTRFTGAGELMVEGREGYCIDTPADVDGLVGCMNNLFEAGLRLRMGRAARALAEQHTQEHQFRDLMAVFERAAAESGSPRRAA